MTVWQWLTLLEATWVAVLTTWIVWERRSPAATLAWIFGLALLPAIGLPIYYFLGPRRLARKRLRYEGLRARLASELAEVARRPEIPPDIARQVKLGLRLGEANLAPATELMAYRDGGVAFSAIESAVSAARHHLHLEIYIFEPDRAGTRLRDLLTERAAAGVEVRLLVDALGSARAKRTFFAPLVEAGGEVARFNPLRLSLLRSRFFNFRTHRKIVVADGEVGFTGGMNVSDCHTVGRGGEPPWRDTHLRLAGPAVAGLQRTFLENWQFAVGRAPRGTAYFPHAAVAAPPPAADGAATADLGSWVQVLRSGPDRTVFPIHEFLFTAIAGADSRVLLTNPYLVPDEPILAALRSAAHRGVDVRILVPSRGDSRLVTLAMRSFYAELLTAGVRLFEYLPAMLHAKTLVVDRDLALIGSANLDNRSFRLNFEAAVAVYGPALADQLASWFEEDLLAARPLGLRGVLGRPIPLRFAESAARLFADVL